MLTHAALVNSFWMAVFCGMNVTCAYSLFNGCLGYFGVFFLMLWKYCYYHSFTCLLMPIHESISRVTCRNKMRRFWSRLTSNLEGNAKWFFQSDCTNLQSHQMFICVPIAIHLTSTWYYKTFIFDNIWVWNGLL